jgi:hypothetical protein
VKAELPSRKSQPILESKRNSCINELRVQKGQQLIKTFLFLGFALTLSTVLVSQAQSSEPLPATQNAQAIKKAQMAGSINPAFELNSYSGYCVYHYNGDAVIINCSDAGINGNSRVVASICATAPRPV